MTGAGLASFPSSRALALGWQDPDGALTQRVWLSTLRGHRLEALVETVSCQPLDSLSAVLLRSLAVRAALPDRSLLQLGLRELLRDGLVETTATGWSPTPLGQQALDTGQATIRRRLRQCFFFLDNSAYQRPAHFLVIPPTVCVRIPTPADWQFQMRWLLDAVGQSQQWKQRHQFPETVSAVVNPDADDWRSVMVDFPEQSSVMILQRTAEHRSTLQGFAVMPGSETVQPGGPAFTLPEGWEEVFPELSAESPQEAWRAEWLRWAAPHGLSAGEAEACQVQKVGPRAVIQAPAQLVAHYRTGPRADALRQQGWLLVGEGRSREAARIELTEAGERGA